MQQHRRYGTLQPRALLPDKNKSADYQPGRARGSGKSHAVGPDAAPAPHHHHRCARQDCADHFFGENSMSSTTDTIRDLAQQDYKWGFVTEIGEDRAPRGLNEDI